MQEFINWLKTQNLSSSEIRMAIDIKVHGITFTKCIYEFNTLYDSSKIDGFADSAIKVMEIFYGEKKVRRMKKETLIKKVFFLQSTITNAPDMQHVIDEVENYSND